MADVKKELLEVGVITPFPSFSGKRTSTDKRCFNGRIPDTLDDEGRVIKRGATIKTSHKVRIDLPVPVTDEEAKSMYGVDIFTLTAAGCTQGAYGLNKTDAYLESIGERDIDVAGLTSLVEGDMPKQERVKTSAVTKQKAQAYDALMAKAGVDNMADLEAMIAHAQAMKAKGKGKKEKGEMD